ncbi:MAG: DUF2157 domain-containing protein [Rhizobiaceae bacterium]
MQLGYVSRLKNDSGRWVEKGIIDKDAAEEILAEVQSQKRGYSFASIIIMLGLVCLAFAAMTFVAANWDVMPRYVRVLLLISAMWAAYGGAVFANSSDSPVLADFLAMLGSAVFGATIMLVGQIYHMQGNAKDAVLLWAGGAFLAAIILRSSASLWLAIGLFTLWFALDLNIFFEVGREINFLYLLFWVACAGAAYWLKARRSAHLLMLGILFWMTITAMDLAVRDKTLTYFLVMYAAFYVFIALAIVSLEKWKVLHEFEASFISYMVMSIIGMTAFWVAASSFDGRFIIEVKTASVYLNSHVPMAVCLAIALGILAFGWNQKLNSKYDLAFCAIWIAASMYATSYLGFQIPFISEAVALGLSIWFISMGERQDIASVTRLGYLAFTMIMVLIYFRTVGSLIGTAGFYLVSGVLLVLGAIFVPRVFKALRKDKEASA